MLFNLSDILTEQHKPIDVMVDSEMETFSYLGEQFGILDRSKLHLRMRHVKEKQYCIEGNITFSLDMRCDRCLAPVAKEVELDFVKNIDLSVPDGEESEEFDESYYINGYYLDVDQLICGEMLIGWPTKVLCREDCKGVCNNCGQNLNLGSCDCEDTSLDPRMSVIQDIFKNFKEV